MTSADILSRVAGRRVLVIGDLMLDHYVWGDVSRISPEAPVPVVHVTRETDAAGGAANVALNLAALGVSAELIGCLGVDEPATRLRRLVEARGISMEYCVGSAMVPTIVKTRVIARAQQLCRIDHEAPRAAYAQSLHSEIDSRLDEAVRRADAVIVSDYAKGVVTQALLDRVLAMGRAHGRLIALDPKPGRRLNFAGAGVITPNRAEALELAGLTESGGEVVSLDEIVARIYEVYAPDLLIITLGAEGMAICRDGRVEHRMPTEARDVFDVSGAGDTVIACLTAALAAGASPFDAAHMANLAAGIVVSKIGTAIATPAEIIAFDRSVGGY